MFIKCFNGTLGALVAFSVFCVAVLIAITVLRVMVMGGMTVWSLAHS